MWHVHLGKPRVVAAARSACRSGRRLGIGVRRRSIRGLAAVSLLSLLSACRTWQPTTEAPRTLVREQRPTTVRLTESDGTTITLRQPLVVGDSIVSGRAPPSGATVVPPRLGVRAENVRSVEVARFSTKRTVALAAVIAGVTIGWIRVAREQNGGAPPDDGTVPKQPAIGLSARLGFLLDLFR